MGKWRYGVSLVLVAAVVVSLGGTMKAGAASRPARLDLTAQQVTGQTVPGGAIEVSVSLANLARAGGASAARPSFTISAPAGFRFTGATNLDRVPGFGGAGTPKGRVSCTGSAGTATCAYGGLLAAGGTVTVLAGFAVPAAAKPGRRVVFRVSGGGSAAGKRASAAIFVREGKGAPGLYAEVQPAGIVRTDRGSREVVQVLNTGSATATSVQLANLLPSDLIGSWSSSGAGWSCTGAQDAPPTCTNTRPVRPGAFEPELRISFTLDQARVAALNLPLGGKAQVEDWSVSVTSTGGARTYTAASPAELALMPPPGALLMATAVAKHGLQELLPGQEFTIDAKLSNLGGAATDGPIGLAGTIPPGTSLVRIGAPGVWQCQGGATPATTSQDFDCTDTDPTPIKAGAAVAIPVVLDVDVNAKPGPGAFAIAGIAKNSIAAARPRATTMQLQILQGNKGFPALTLLRPTGKHGAFQPVNDGAAAKLISGRPFTERIDVRNAGGAAIDAGSTATLEQSLGGDAKIVSIQNTPGFSCSGTTSLTCTVVFGSALARRASLSGPTIVIDAGAATKGERSWPATIHLDEDDAPTAAKLPVLVTITHGEYHLIPDFTNIRLPTAGGTGEFGLSVRNTGDIATSGPVVLSVHLPRGVRFDSLVEHGWACETVATSARCTSVDALQPGHHLPHVTLRLSFGKSTGLKTVSLEARATVGSRAAPKSARAAMPVEARHALRAVIKDPDKVDFDDDPLVKAHEKLKASVISLEGDGSGGSGVGLHYRWAERSGPAVDWLGPRDEADVEFKAPTVTKATKLAFALTVTDGSATSTATTHVNVVPLAKSGSGFDIDQAKGKKEKPDGPLREKRKLPKPAEQLKKTAKKTVRVPAASNTPMDTTTTAETTTGETTTGETTTGETTTAGTTTGESGLPAIFCELVRDAINSSGSFQGTVGGVSFGFDSINVSGDDCSSSTTISFSGSSFSTSSLKADGVSGSISAAGLTISGGTLTGPEAWHSPTFTLGGAGLAIPFGAGSVALTGTIEADGFAFVPLPSGWNGSTSLTFSTGSSGTSVSVDTTATGPKSDESPDSPAPTAEIQGAIASDGTFSLTVDVQQIVQLAGSPVNLSGSVKRDTPDGAISSSFEGSITKPITIVPGLDINTLTVKMEPTDDSLGLTGEGSIGLATPNGSVGVDVELAYDNPKNWSLTATGSGDATWSPLPGLTIAAKDFSGAIVAHDDTYDLTLKVAPSTDWKPSANVTISNLQLSLSNQCDDTGAPCPEDADVFLNVSGDVAFDLPSIGTLDTSIAGTLALPTGEFSVKASLNEPLSVGAGIQITDASVLIQRGMTQPSEDPSAESSDSGDYRVDLEGAVSVPGIGQLPTVHASFSNQGWAIAVPLGGFSLPGSSGDGSQLGNAVIGWASYATKLDVVDPVTHAVTSIDLGANQFKLTGTFSTPSWLKTMLGLSSDVQGRATGIFDPDNDTYSLRMDFSVPGQPYLYGDANSKANVRLNSTFFEIERTGGSFNISLGGAATMNVASSGGTGGAAASSAGVTIALGYAVTSNTVTGTFSLVSQNGWSDAFGVPKLTLYNLDIQFGITLTAPLPLPSIGFGAAAQLPPNWQSKLGLQNNPKTTLVANISVTNPCIAIQVDDPTNTGKTVLSLGNGVLTASAFDVEVAPTGCTVGSFTYAPGVSLNFDGTIAGVSVAIKASLLLNPFSFTGSADIGSFQLAGVTVKQTHIDATLSPSQFAVNFSGGVSVGGTDVTVSGGVNKKGSTLITDFNGTLNQLNLGNGAVTANNLAVNLHTETGSKNNVAFSMSGAVTILTANAKGNFKLVVQNGQLNELTADITANVQFGGSSGLGLNGTFHVDYQPNQPFTLTANVTANFAGQSLANVSVNVQSSYLQITAGFSIGSVFSAQLTGAAYYGTVPKGTTIAIPGGASVAAQTGDFLLSAKDVTLSLAGFTGKASVYLAKAGGVTQGGLSGSLQVLGTGSGNSVNVSGTFKGSDFALAGDANLNLAGFTAATKVSVVKTGQSVAVTGAAAVSVLGSTVNLNGSFSYDSGQFHYRLSGNASVNAGGYNLANTAFTASNYPSDAGLYANVNFGVGSVVRVAGKLNVTAAGGFYLSANATLNLSFTSVNGNVTFQAGPQQQCYLTYTTYTFFGLRFQIPSGYACGTVNVPATLTATASVSAAGFSFGVNVRVSGDGSYSATASSPTTGEYTGTTPTISLIVVRGYAYISYHMRLTIQSSSPRFAVDGAGGAGIKYQHWEVSGWPWDWGWSGWKDGPSISASIQTNPFKACGYVSLFGKDVGGCIG